MTYWVNVGFGLLLALLGAAPTWLTIWLGLRAQKRQGTPPPTARPPAAYPPPVPHNNLPPAYWEVAGREMAGQAADPSVEEADEVDPADWWKDNA